VKPRIFAALSALCSMAYLLGTPIGIVLLFFNWRAAAIVLAVAVCCAPLAKWFNGLKLRTIFGDEEGHRLNERAWKDGGDGPPSQ
jgi:hypothetical protein